MNFKMFRRYRRWIGFADALTFFAYDLFRIKTCKQVKIAKQMLFARTTTQDVEIAAHTLIFEEYSDIVCANPAVIVDAGANIGTSAIYFATRYPDAKIISIEPEKENYQILLKNIKNFVNIIPINAALCSDSKNRLILDRQTGPCGYTVSETTNETVSTFQTVKCVTIIELMKKFNFNYIDILKMDIEGGEKEVLDSSPDWINKVKIITIELHDRIVMGCDRAFYLATVDFNRFLKKGEKVTAYRE